LTKPVIDAILAAAERHIRERVASSGQVLRRLDEDEAALIRDDIRLTEAFTSGDLSPATYKLKSDELRARRSRLIQHRARGVPDAQHLMAKVARTLEIAASLKDLYDAFSDDRRAALLREVFSAVVLSSDGITGFVLRPPFDELASSAKNDPRKLSVERRNQLAASIIDAA
jgi:hypothetical protein